MEGPDLKQVVRTIEGVIALCLGSAGRVVWVNQIDAAAFNDGDKVYLPAPTGSHPGEYDLLLAIALREVAKVSFSQSGHIGTLGDEARPYAECVEEARLKTMLAYEYRGSPAIFDKAAGIAAGIFANGAAEGELDAAHANRLAIWAAAHDAALGTAGSAEVLTKLRGLATQQTPAEQLDAAIGIARQAPAAVSTEMSAALGVQIAEALRSQPEQQDQQPSDGQQDQQDQQPSEGPQDSQEPQEQEPGSQEQAGQGGDQDDSKPQDQQAGSGAEEQSNDADQADDKDKGGETDAPEDGDGGVDSPQENAADGQQGGRSPGEAGGSDDESDQSGEAGGSGQQPSAGSSSEDGSSDATPKGGAKGSSGDDAGDEAPQAESTESSDGTDEAVAAQGGDILSDALAKTRGHQKARDVSAQAEALQQDSSAESEAELSEGQLEALKAALDNPVDPGDAVYAAAETDSASEIDAAAGDDEACQLDIAGQLGGDALAEDASPGCNVLTGVPARLVSVLTREYQDKRRRPFQRAVGGQQIAVPHAWRLKAMGDVRVFRKKAPACGIDAAVSFLLDRSLSMDNVGMEAAAGVTYAMALAHQRIAGTQVSIDVFPGCYSESEQMLGFKQNLRAAEERLKTIVADGGTPMGSAIAKRLTLLLATRSLKKAMYVITDGRPNCGELELTRHLIREATAAGVVMIGVGINAEVGDLFPISAKVAGVDDLADALERLFKTELVDRLAA